MTPDLLTACVFCGMSLLRTGLPASPGLSAEFAASYATLERRDDSPTVFHNDASDVTPKFLLVGMGNAGDAAPGLGAGTPAREWFARLSIANSHDEQSQTFRIPDAVVATGTGRYENFEAGARIPLGARDSVEAAVAQRVHKIVDLVNLGGSKFQFSEERDLFAQRVDVSIGWRHRFTNAEIGAAFREVRPEGKYNTAFVYRQGKQWMPGGQIEGRWRHGTFSLGASAEAEATDMDVNEQRVPDFAHVSYTERATLSAASLFVEKTWGGTDLSFSIGADRSRLPFVAMAILGEETRYFDAGYRSVSRTREVVWDLAARHRISPGVHLRGYVRVIQGGETVSMTDPAGALPPVELSVRRGGHFPITQFTLGGGADFSIGRSRGAD
ncbi:MAG TPA: hypothetical protein VFS34_00280 [Thermoanaerobaculia bacterium]|nr:hypothetical protein [Thermoanaerobaculia bacterium]